jgi:hypothetical protein
MPGIGSAATSAGDQRSRQPPGRSASAPAASCCPTMPRWWWPSSSAPSTPCTRAHRPGPGARRAPPADRTRLCGGAAPERLRNRHRRAALTTSPTTASARCWCTRAA